MTAAHPSGAGGQFRALLTTEFSPARAPEINRPKLNLSVAAVRNSPANRRRAHRISQT